MLNFSQDQLSALSFGKRRATEPPSAGNSTDIVGRPAKRARLASPEQDPNGAPSPIPTAPVLAVRGPTRQLLAVPDAPRYVSKTTASKKVHAEIDRQVECLARQVCDAQHLALDSAIFVIRKTKLGSSGDVADWLQLCAMLCLHYDAQKDKEPLWQCLERLLRRIDAIHRPGNCVLYDAAATSLLATSTTAGFIRILQRAKESEGGKGRLAALFRRTGILSTLKLAFEQEAAGQHPEKTAQQTAAELLLARAAQATPAPDGPRYVGPPAGDEDLRADIDRIFERVAQQVRDAQQLAPDRAIFAIRDVTLHSPGNVTDWLQLCAVLCLHYDATHDNASLRQCLEQVLRHIARVRQCGNPVLYDTMKIALLATSTPAGFIRILERASDNECEKGVVASLFKETRMMGLLKQAFAQQAAGLHPEKTAQQAAAEFLLAHHAPPPAYEPDPYFVPITAESIGWSDTTAHSHEGWTRDPQHPVQNIDVSSWLQVLDGELDFDALFTS